ncbi:hypothetical protein VQ042_23970 [Aurantimonas sp. A2-1-M11]|uniref:hypothetical protein n=1 Tax=Aurantimonas sp. A2-1-M11 TaxID=3113712 RepID=UPI002F958CD1
MKPINLVERRFIRGKALSAAVSGAFANSFPRNLLTGEEIQLTSFMFDFSASHFLSILSPDEVEKATGQAHASSRLLANIYVADESQRLADPRSDELRRVLIEGTPAEDVLSTQFLNEKCIDRLDAGDYRGFLEERAALMYRAAQDLVGVW